MAERKNPELDVQHQAILRNMMKLPENRQCADCRNPSPRWASTNLGIFICMSCSGIHRNLGTHISQVRSVTLDTWTSRQIAHFQKFGNAKAAEYFEACLPVDFRRPPPGDAMPMERFIRDKYEKKRYISTENGGLGGMAPDVSHRRRAYQGSGATHSKPAARESHSGARYDNTNTRSGTAMPLSYGDRFRSGANAPNDTIRRTTTSTGKFNLTRKMGTLSRPGSAMQRAHAVKELINMGFSSELAARATEASNGDLEKAVNWVLENSPSTENLAGESKPAAQPIQDLLDFGSPAAVSPTMALKTGPAPLMTPSEVMHVERQTPLSEAAVDSAEKNSLADFADFGAFESALPAVANLATTPTAPFNKSALSSSIASLYASGSKAASTRTTSSRTTSSSLSKPGPAHNPGAQLSQTGFISKVDVNPMRTSVTPPKAVLSTAIPSFNWPGAAKGMASSSLPAENGTTFPAKTPKLASIQRTDIRPPPPPMDGSGDAAPAEIPPPPSCPPPALHDLPSPGPSKAELKANPAIDGGKTKCETVAQGKTAATSEVSKNSKEVEDDPFAALSMFAMSSAKSKNPTAKLSTSLELELNGTAVPAADIPLGSGNAAHVSGIDLDNLLG